VRADKAPEDATTEQEILELYRMQRRIGVRGGGRPRKRRHLTGRG
jgi:hypothetical protein